ncbi:MAG: dihydroxy-acid dehydratase [Enterocloster clostridioformis]
MELVQKGITTRDILTEHAFENAVMHLLTMGGSTNGILHLQAIYHEADWGNCRGFLIPITGTCSKRPKSTLLLQEVLRGVFSPDAVPLCVQSPLAWTEELSRYVFIILTYAAPALPCWTMPMSGLS